MSHTLTLNVPDEVFTFLSKTAQAVGQQPEVLAAQWLTTVTEHLTNDPVERFIGAFKSSVPDWADHHDTYIGSVIMESMQGTEYAGHYLKL